MTWSALRQYKNENLEDCTLEMSRAGNIADLAFFREHGQMAIGQKNQLYADVLIARGAAVLRSELEALVPALAPSIAAGLRKYAHLELVPGALVLDAGIVNIFEIVGIDIPSTILESFRPFVRRIETARHDIPEWHWIKALLALALDEPLGWEAIAGVVPGQPTAFVAGQTFGLNMQELIAYLGSALQHAAALDDVLPAWYQFMGAAPSLTSAGQIDDLVVLWVARIVFHHIGREPLGKVGDRVYEAVDRLVAAGL